MGAGIDLRIDRAAGAPVGAQLTGRIRAAVSDRRLSPGDRLPSVRELAESAGVHVNTARAVYARLESEGLVRSEHGRGTFVAGTQPGRPDEARPSRRELRTQIAALEATLARLPPPPLPRDDEPTRPPAGAALLSTEELLGVRDTLLHRLRQLEAERTAVLRSLEELAPEQLATEPLGAQQPGAAARHSTPSLAGARIRWVGA
jgi:DNA-binding transcriptional regulator YhcF (GntR family)